MNRELGGDFDLAAFRFVARWNEARGAVQSFLVSERQQRVRIPAAGVVADFAAGDEIHTESSYKFTCEEIIELAASCGYAEKKTYTDAAGRYALSLLTVL